MKPRKKTVKIFSRIPVEEYERLSLVCKRGGFKSNYEIIQSLIHCFLRTTDKEYKAQEEPIPDEIQNMFTDLSNTESPEYVKPKRKASIKTVNDE
jgi:hypothetical protein